MNWLRDLFRRKPREEGWTIIPMDPAEQRILDELRRRREEAARIIPLEDRK